MRDRERERAGRKAEKEKERESKTVRQRERERKKERKTFCNFFLRKMSPILSCRNYSNKKASLQYNWPGYLLYMGQGRSLRPKI